MTAINFTIYAKPFRYFVAAVAVFAALAALIAVWDRSTEPPVVVHGRLSAPGSAARALSHSDGRERAVSEFISRVDLRTQDARESLTSDDLAWWWPEQVGNAARAFHCAPKTSQDTRHLVMVWTDTQNNVVAYGAAIQGGVLPPYATGLVDANEPALRRLVYPAAQGFRVVAAEKTYALEIRDTRLACIPTSGD